MWSMMRSHMYPRRIRTAMRSLQPTGKLTRSFAKTPGYCRLPDTRKEAEEEEKRGKKRQYAGDIDSDSDVTPLAEVYDALPVFDAKG